MLSYKLKLFCQFSLALFVLLSSNFTLAGGGSSTGGGTVKVCIAPQSVEKVRDRILENHRAPELVTYPFANLTDDDILSVELVDIIESENPDNDSLEKMYDEKFNLVTNNYVKKNDFYGLFKDTVNYLNEELTNKGPSVLNWDSELQNTIYGMRFDSQFKDVPNGIILDPDFESKYQNSPNCFFASVIRQSLDASGKVDSDSIRKYFLFEYDSFLISHMKPWHQVALVFHEIVYNMVLDMLQAHPENAKKIGNISVFVRKWTDTLLVYYITEVRYYSDRLDSLRQEIGFSPYPNKKRIFQDLSDIGVWAIKHDWVSDVPARYENCYDIGYLNKILLPELNLVTRRFCISKNGTIALDLANAEREENFSSILDSFRVNMKKNKEIYFKVIKKLPKHSLYTYHHYMEIDPKSLKVKGFVKYDAN